VSDFAENLRKAMFDKRYKAIDVARGTNITPSVISRYLTGAHQPSTDNLLVISKKYLGISPEALLSSSDAPESIQKSRVGSSVTEPLLKTIEVQDKLIKNLEKQITSQSHYIHALFKNLEEAKAESKERHTKGREKTKNPTKPKKRKVGFMKKHKKAKS